MRSPETGRRKSPVSRIHVAQRPHAPRLNGGKARKSGPIRQRPGTVGSYRSGWWWMQPDRTGLHAKFPFPNREKNREFRGIRPTAAISASHRRANSMACKQIPYRKRTGNFWSHNRELFSKNREFSRRSRELDFGTNFLTLRELHVATRAPTRWHPQQSSARRTAPQPSRGLARATRMARCTSTG